MEIKALHVEFKPDNLISAFVLTESVANDLAAYRLDMDHQTLELYDPRELLTHVVRAGMKQSKSKALEIFTIPDGKHYRI